MTVKFYRAQSTGAGTGNLGAISAGTQLATSGTVILSNSNGISFGMAGSATITASFAAIKAISVNGGSVTNGTVSYADANGVSWGVAGSTITASVNPGGVALSAGTTLATSGTVSFANGSGVSFGLAGQTMTASVAAQTTQPAIVVSAGTQLATSGTISFSDVNGISFGLAGSATLTASFNAIKSISAGTTRITSGEAVWSNSNGLSFGANGNTVTVTFAAIKSVFFNTGTTNGIATVLDFFTLANTLGVSWASNATNARVYGAYGGGATVSAFQDPSMYHNSHGYADGMVSFYRVAVPYFVRATQVQFLIDHGAALLSSDQFTLSIGVYTMAGSTASLASSGSRTWSYTLTNFDSGPQYRTVGGTYNLTPGDYLFAVHARTTNIAGVLSFYGLSSNSINPGTDGAVATAQYVNAFSISSFSTAMPASFNLTNTNVVRTGASAYRQPGFMYLGT